MAGGIRWHLELGANAIAWISDEGEYDFPWTYGRWVDSPEFERFRSYFADEEEWPDDDPVIEALCNEVQANGGFTLRDIRSGAIHTNSYPGSNQPFW